VRIEPAHLGLDAVSAAPASGSPAGLISAPEAIPAGSLADAVELCERVAPLHPLFVEDPLHIMDDYEAFALLRQKVRVPLAAGEQFGELRDGNLPLVEKELIDFLRSTIPNVGGISGFRKLASLCEAHGVAMVPHFTPPIATAAVIHALLPFPGQALNEVLRPALPPYGPCGRSRRRAVAPRRAEQSTPGSG